MTYTDLVVNQGIEFAHFFFAASMANMRTRLFADESKSLRSFRVSSQPLASPLSLKASSLFLPSPPPFLHCTPSLQDLISDNGAICFHMGLPPTYVPFPYFILNLTLSLALLHSQKHQCPMSEPPPHIPPLFQLLITPFIRQKPPHHPWSKPRTIIRKLTTKFNPRTYTSSPVIPRLSPLPSGPNAFSKENREAALRERGLLPPLKRNKDLSAQEKDQDRAIPIILPNDDQLSSTEDDSPSAADLVKREWEAKNRILESNQLHRMNSFKFGGNRPCPATPIILFSSSESADSVVPDSKAQPAREPMSSSLADVAIPHLPPSALEDPLVLPPVPTSQPGSRPVTPLLDIPPEIAAYLFPLPPSPRSVSRPIFDLSSRPPSPTSVPLPRSPSLRSVFDTTSLRSSSGALTPCPLDNRGPSLTPTPSAPIIAITPCAVIYSDDTTSSPLHKRTDLSVPDESVSSSQPPSLDGNSGTTTDSILGTSESSAAISGKGRLGGLNIKTHEGSCYNIPAIVESPIEDSFLEKQYVVVEPPSTFEDTDQAALAPMSAPINGSEPRFTLSTPRMNRRGVTDPTNGNLNRKKSMITNPFKRGLSSGYEDQLTTPSSGEPHRRLSVKTSFSNIRRSVVGTLSRRISSPDRGAGVGRMNDVARSPTSLGSTMEEEEEVRKAVSPILYSRGHILMEASHIKDEESRRVTEMAFLT